MLGAIIGDLVGSRFEFNNHKSKDFDFLTRDCFFTDDSLMTIAIGEALMTSQKDYSDLKQQTITLMQKHGRNYDDCGFGGRFYNWIFEDNPKPYQSYGNGAPMRVSCCGIVGSTIDEVKQLSKMVTEISHDHPESLKAAEAVAVCVYMARKQTPKQDIYHYVKNHYYPLDFTLDDIRPTYKFNESSQGTTPYALKAFFESKGFTDAIRLAVSIGGDTDTIAAITGNIAGEYYGITNKLKNYALTFLPFEIKEIVEAFDRKYPIKKVPFNKNIENPII